jgi:glycosyltransferase involved in cell wall biosynthesis
MRIAIVHPFSWPSVRRGAERYVADLAWYLAESGHRVDVVTGSDRRSTTADGTLTTRAHRHMRHDVLARRRITEAETFGLVAFPTLVRRRYDVVHAMTPTSALAARAAGQRVVFTALGHASPDRFRTRPRDSAMFALAVRAATVTTVLSGATAKVVSSLTGREVEVLAPGVRIDQFAPDLSPRTGPPRLLFSSDAGDRRKRVDLALAATALLGDRRPGIRLQLGGPGDHSWALDRLDGDGGAAATAAVDVLGTGDLDAVPSRYRAATATVLPADDEAFGLVLVESLACGTPVVCVRSGGPPEIVDDERVGRIADAGDAASLAAALDAVVDLAADPATPARCAQHARRWGWVEAIGPAHEALYDRVRRR